MSRENSMVEGHETVILSALMNGSPSLPVVADDFSSPPNRVIFNRILKLKNRGLLAVTDALRHNRELERVGGAARITEISYLPHDDQNLKYALDEVLAASRERQATQIGKDLASGKIVALTARRKLEEILSRQQERQPEVSWRDALKASVVTSSELRKLKLTPRRKLLGDWLCEGDYGIIFSPRGVGKTWLGLLIAKTVATGGTLGEWEAPNPSKVLYIDGEMPADLMRDRDKGLGAGEVEFLNHAILFDRCEKVLNITDDALQAAILAKCIRDNIKLLVLDNLSTLASGIKENDSFEWERLHNWLLQFRRHKIAVILIHHAGRNNEARGTSKREDAAFWVIALDDKKKHADDKRGARYITRFTKPSRNTQDEVPSYEWHVVTDSATGEVSVACKIAQTMDVFRQLIEDGVTECNQLAQELKVTPGTISKWAKKGMDESWLEKKGREYRIVDNGNEGNENE